MWNQSRVESKRASASEDVLCCASLFGGSTLLALSSGPKYGRGGTVSPPAAAISAAVLSSSAACALCVDTCPAALAGTGAAGPCEVSADCSAVLPASGTGGKIASWACSSDAEAASCCTSAPAAAAAASMRLVAPDEVCSSGRDKLLESVTDPLLRRVDKVAGLPRVLSRMAVNKLSMSGDTANRSESSCCKIAVEAKSAS